MMELGLVSVLKGSPTVAGGRVFPRLPQNPTFPLVRYQLINVTRTNDIGGDNVGPSEFTIQIDCMGKSYADAKTLAASVFSRLNGYNGIWGSSVCRFCTIESENDFYEQDGDDVTHWVTQRYLIWTNDD
jgi:hypothetical protein